MTDVCAVFSLPCYVRHGLAAGLTMEVNRFILSDLPDTRRSLVVNIGRFHNR